MPVWYGPDWSELDRTGVRWTGPNWTGPGWIAMGWAGKGWVELSYRRPSRSLYNFRRQLSALSLISNIPISNFQALHRPAHRVPFLVSARSPPLAPVAMVKAISTVAKRLAKRTVLFAPGGKGGVIRRPGSAVPVPKRQAAAVASKRAGLEWVQVVAPAYISGVTMHILPVLPHQYCIATVFITDHRGHVHVLHLHVVSPVCV